MRVMCALVLAAGCYHPSPQAGAPCNSKGECPSGLQCVEDHCVDPRAIADASVEVDACPAVSCLGNDLAGCGSRITCALGCADADAATPAHCRQMVPSNGITSALLQGATADISGIDVEFDSDTGLVTRQGGMPVRPAGTGVMNGIGFVVIDGMGVFSANSFDVTVASATDEDWDLTGANTIAFFAATTINVAGRIDAGGQAAAGGPGGADGASSGSSGPTCRGKAGGWTMAGVGEGGGGGGGRTAGGAGAPSNSTTFGAGGPACSASPTTIPLRGGNGGGAGGVDTSASPDVIHGGRGGGGGGGVALVAMESITISGQVTSPGAGGLTSATGDGGGGGGTGGAILLEAPVVTITNTGALTANGGGGGGPMVDNGSRGHPSDGNAASGGTHMSVSGGRGGTGSVSPTAGATLIDGTNSRGAGGGGAAGRTEIKARTRVTTGAALSPGPALTDISTQ